MIAPLDRHKSTGKSGKFHFANTNKFFQIKLFFAANIYLHGTDFDTDFYWSYYMSVKTKQKHLFSLFRPLC